MSRETNSVLSEFLQAMLNLPLRGGDDLVRMELIVMVEVVALFFTIVALVKPLPSIAFFILTA